MSFFIFWILSLSLNFVVTTRHLNCQTFETRPCLNLALCQLWQHSRKVSMLASDQRLVNRLHCCWPGLGLGWLGLGWAGWDWAGLGLGWTHLSLAAPCWPHQPPNWCGIALQFCRPRLPSCYGLQDSAEAGGGQSCGCLHI